MDGLVYLDLEGWLVVVTNSAGIMVFGKFFHASEAEDVAAFGNDRPEVGLKAY